MIGNDWDEKLKVIWESPGFKNFYKKIIHEYDTKEIYPPKAFIFNALKLTSYEKTKVVMGQDPYHGKGEAHGLSFSVQKGIKIPPSLQNIYKELNDDLGIPPKDNGDLTGWALQGVLLLNSVLTVEKDKAASHRNLGWEPMTDYIIMSPHPSPFSAYSGFFGSKPFSKTNEFLIKNGLVPIDWSK